MSKKNPQSYDAPIAVTVELMCSEAILTGSSPEEQQAVGEGFSWDME